ncbi:SDR family oxidoreductase [Gilvimarinus sp. SDUM040013]|uniref:SDR family oxidoreductase n=1 Tax=Gilvimarinus gilvus TaxID=3058038 RepID=A0ABU4RU27_9GAMM|nr:SDR family oxidoreductase [Gilvimarinus sp. SDUM040013]MDO3385002.1 SDR family oxidoreductase [Gilvimarinus sp. SDUM040013]MDX6848377.1 SDR family oxidoreductase [Gilvimarinus sp. SDUM040013]
MNVKRSILITGCSSGIGYYCAHTLAKNGWQVIASCRDAEDAASLKAEGLEAIVLDLADTDSILDGLKQTLALTGGRLDALFNNGAYGQPGAVEDLSRDTLRKQFETNFFGWCELTNEVVKVMLTQDSGRIIHNSSVLGFAAMPFRGAYNASKFALEGIADTMRLELADTNIQLSLIEPGPITSEFRKNALRALEGNIDFNASRHGFKYAAAVHRLAKEGPASRFTLGPEAVYKRLDHALNAKRAKPRYYVTFPTYLMGYLKRILTTRMMDNILGRISS